MVNMSAVTGASIDPADDQHSSTARQPKQLGTVSMVWEKPYPQEEAEYLRQSGREAELSEDKLFSVLLEDGQKLMLVSRHHFSEPSKKDFKRAASNKFQWHSHALKTYPRMGLGLELTPAQRIRNACDLKDRGQAARLRKPNEVSLGIARPQHTPGAHMRNYGAFGDRRQRQNKEVGVRPSSAQRVKLQRQLKAMRAPTPEYLEIMKKKRPASPVGSSRGGAPMPKFALSPTVSHQPRSPPPLLLGGGEEPLPAATQLASGGAERASPLV